MGSLTVLAQDAVTAAGQSIAVRRPPDGCDQQKTLIPIKAAGRSPWLSSALYRHAPDVRT